MELLGILAFLLVLGIPVSIIALFVGQSGLRRRITALERELAEERRARLLTPAVAATSVPATDAAEPQAEPELEAVSDTPAPPPVPAEPADPTVAAARRGPWQVAAGAPLTGPQLDDKRPADEPPDQNDLIVLRPDRIAALFGWLRDNWIYAVSGVSLALAGIFLVQWGAERGLLSPGFRVLAAMALGGALVIAGEWVRRRYSDTEGSTAYLPSVFSGAGIVALFAAITAARQMYGLIGPTPTFAGLLCVAALAIALGWFHGPLLAALGLIGATGAPFVIDSPASDASLLHGYFLLVAITGLAIDAVRRWAWISVLALALSYGAGALLQMAGSAAPEWWVLQLVALPLITACLPDLSWRPVQGGITLSESILVAQGREWPGFPTRIAAAALALSSFLIFSRPGWGATDLPEWMALAGLALAFTLWAAGARGMADLAALPTAAFLARLMTEAWSGTGPFTTPLPPELPEDPYPPPEPLFWLLIALTALIGAGFALRAIWNKGGERAHGVIWGFAAVALPSTVLVWLELVWRPWQPGLDPWHWALVVMAHAAAATLLALTFARIDAPDRRRTAHAALAALCLIALALFVLTSAAPLTLALTVLVVAAAGLDRRFDLPEFGLFIMLGLAVLIYRLGVDPGIVWALEGPLAQVAIAHLGAIAGIAAAWVALAPRDRKLTRLALESSGATIIALTASVAITRWITRNDAYQDLGTHWGSVLNALPWLMLMLSQLYRMRPGVWGNALRMVVAAIGGIGAIAGLGVALGPANPLVSSSEPVIGPPVLDSLLLAYAIPGAILILAMRAMPHLAPTLRTGLTVIGIALVTLYAALEIRRFWRGDDLSVYGVTQPELYTYTLAMMLTGAALLWQAIARRSPGLRRIAMTVIALTAAKVFLIDASGLTGLVRVASFLGLGLTLAGLAWLNRWATQATRTDG